jgi:predicted anti-sigma-YlaC factor YlaD
MAMIFRRHPSKKRLEAWLALQSTPDIDDHIENCERCSTLLDDMASASTDSALRDALSEVLAPPPDLAARVEARVTERLEQRRMLGYMADLFGAGWEVTRLLITDDPWEENT